MPRDPLKAPLRRLLSDTQRLIHERGSFDPRSTRRHFVVAAPDFLAALILPRLVEHGAIDARHVTFEIVPSASFSFGSSMPRRFGERSPKPTLERALLRSRMH